MQTGARPAESSPARAVGALEAHAFQPGESIGPSWRAERFIRAGAVFEIWLARGVGAVPAAVKAPRPSVDRALARALLRHEHDCLVLLCHAHTVVPYALVDEQDCTALVMEWLGGGDLVSLAGATARHWLGPLGELVAALAHVHARGYVHRDVKARNVMFDGRGRARLIDFGSAARQGAAVPPGGVTAAHRRSDEASTVAVCEDDHYALAVLIYELSMGRLPRGVDGRERPPERLPPSGDATVDGVLEWAMAWLDPDRRTAAGNIAALATVMNLAEYA